MPYDKYYFVVKDRCVRSTKSILFCGQVKKGRILRCPTGQVKCTQK